jgi:hypothetical protein
MGRPKGCCSWFTCCTLWLSECCGIVRSGTLSVCHLAVYASGACGLSLASCSKSASDFLQAHSQSIGRPACMCAQT